MDFSQYERYQFHDNAAMNISTGYKERYYQMHWHSYGEILLVGPGKTNIYKVNQTVYHLVEGDFVLIWPMEMHEIIDADREHSLVIQFSNTFANSVFDLQRIMHFYHNLHVLCIHTHPELIRELHEIAHEMQEIFESGQRDREIKCCMLFMRFMLKLDEHRDEFRDEIDVENRDSYSDDTFRKLVAVTDYIKSNLADEDLSQSAMAEMAGISKDYFSRIFKNVTGMNYSKWLNIIRLEKAISLFPEKNLSLTEIAMLSGFQSIPSFNRVFRDEKGMSPGEYRKLSAQEE